MSYTAIRVRVPIIIPSTESRDHPPHEARKPYRNLRGGGTINLVVGWLAAGGMEAMDGTGSKCCCCCLLLQILCLRQISLTHYINPASSPPLFPSSIYSTSSASMPDSYRFSATSGTKATVAGAGVLTHAVRGNTTIPIGKTWSVRWESMGLIQEPDPEGVRRGPVHGQQI